MDANTKLENKIIDVLKTVYDPEIPINIYDLGLIYKIMILKENYINIEMTLTAPACPMAGSIVEDVTNRVERLDEVKGVNVNLVFEPEWNKEMMSDEAKLELGFL